MGKLHIIDVSIVLGYLVLCLIVGLYKSTKIKNIREYTLGDRNFSTIAVIATLFATYISAQYILGKTGKIYELGLLFALPLFFQPLVWITTSLFFSKNIGRFTHCISVVDIMHSCYGRSARYVTAISSLLFAIAVLSVQTTAIAYLFQHFFNLPYIYGAILGIGLVTLYSTIGGIRSVIYTDIFQFIIFFLIIPIACGYAYFKVGGHKNIINSLPESYKSVEFTLGNIKYIVSLLLLFLMPFIEASYCQRLLLATNKKQISLSLRVIFLCAIFLTISVCLIGVIVKSQHTHIDSNLTFYYFIDYSLAIGIKGFAIVGFLAVIQSSADSWINTSSSIIVKDIVQPHFKILKDSQLVVTAKFCALLISICSVSIALISKQILELIWLVNNFNFPVLFIPLLVALRRGKTTELTFIVSTIVAMVFVVIGKVYTGEFDIESSMIGVIGSAIGFFAAHYIQVKMGIIKKEEEGNDLLKLIMKPPKPTFRERIKSCTRFCFSTTQQMQNGTSYSYTLALFLMVLNIPILIFGHYPVPDAFNIIAQYGRYLILSLALMLILHELIGIKKVNVLLYITLLLTLSIFNIYLLMISGGNIGWWINCFLSILALFLFLPWVLAILFGIIGAGITAILFNTAYWIDRHTPITDYLNSTTLYLYSIIVLISMMIYMAVKKIRDAMSHIQKLEAMGHSIVHDLNAPFAVSGGLIDLTKKALKEKKYDQIPEYLEIMESSNEMAGRDLKTLLQAMSHDPNKQPDDWGEYTASECIKDMLQYFPMRKDEKERLFLVDVKNISGKKEDFVFMGSDSLLRHVLFNLIQNAFVYAGDDAKIEVFIYDNKIYVKDNGLGIPDHIYDKLFEKYTTTIGHGLGLHFCKQAMLKMNGDIECITEEGKGTQFVLSFDVCLPCEDKVEKREK